MSNAKRSVGQATANKEGSGGAQGGGGAKGGASKRTRRDLFTPTPDNVRLVMAAPQSLKAAADSWNAVMSKVNIGVVPSTTDPSMGVLEVRVADSTIRCCIVASNVEISIDHIGANRMGKTVTLNTKQYSEVLKQIVNKGALKMVYDAESTSRGYELSAFDTYSRIKFFLWETQTVGTDTVDIPRDLPAKIHHVMNLNVCEFKSFISFLNKNKNAETFFIRIQTLGDRIFMTIGAKSEDGTGVNAELMFYGTKKATRSASSVPTHAHARPTTPMLRSTHILKVDETLFEQPVEVGSQGNMSVEELEDALALLHESSDATDETQEFLTKFMDSFLRGLEPKSKLTLALGEANNGPFLLIRSTTPKSVTEMILSPRIPDSDLSV